MDLLTLSGIVTGRGQRVLVSAFDLRLSAGALMHLTGANGTGKTTLLEVAAGLRAPWEGQVAAAGARHWVGHRNALSPALTPSENLQAWCCLQTDARPEAVDAALTRLGVFAQRFRVCRALSAGQRRRVALSRLCLAIRPVWVLDEPLDGLDQAGLALFASLVTDHRQRGGAVLVTSHQPLPDGIDDVELRTLEAA